MEFNGSLYTAYLLILPTFYNSKLQKKVNIDINILKKKQNLWSNKFISLKAE